MLSDGDQIHAAEMLDAAERIELYIQGRTPARFMDDLRTIDAVSMNLLRIGEGASKMSDAARSGAVDVPWPKLISLRHRLAHSYASADIDTLWGAASVSVPELATVLRRLLAGS